MNIFVFVLPSDGGHEAWKQHPITKQEFPCSEHDLTKIYSCEDATTANSLMDMLSRQNPGCKVVKTSTDRICQAPIHQGDLTFISITEKGMLPE